MKSFGTIRKIDDLGRIVIPMDLRKNFDIGTNAPIEIFIDDEEIVLQKYTPLKDRNELQHMVNSISLLLKSDCYLYNQTNIIESEHNKATLTDEIKYDLVQGSEIKTDEKILLPILMEDIIIGSLYIKPNKSFTGEDFLTAKAITSFISKQVAI